ncbi:MAG: hypothetical protein ACLGI2_06840 [Acidimicrobiia bacterium]
MSSEGWREAVFPALLVVFALAYLWRITGVLAVEPISSHLSNFYLTGAAVTLLSGRRAFVDPAVRGRALVVAAAFAAVNVVVEVLLAAAGLDDEVNRAMGDVNTSDPVDGLSGLAAVALVVGLLPRRRPAAEPRSLLQPRP